MSNTTPESNISISDIQSDVLQRSSKADNKSLFTVKTANEWIAESKLRPAPKMLFSEFWYEGETCILFADTNTGKSILAVQIGDSISRGECISGFELETDAQPVLYFDFELSDKQFEIRYAVENKESHNHKDHYIWHDNFLRVEINPDADLPDKITFEDYLNQSLEKTIVKTGAKILIIDNLTYLKNETEKAKDALPLMKHLKWLKDRYNLSILALAHTPKRDLSKPITRNDLSGSKMLMNFCDSSFAIGESQSDKSMRYLKQIKVRNIAFVYDTDNVVVCQINKPDNFLQFELLDYGEERLHLKQMTDQEHEDRDELILDLHDQGMSYREIAKQVNCNHMKVARIVKAKKKV